MSLFIYESVVQPILRRLSRSSVDSDTPRTTAGNGNSPPLRQDGNRLQDSSALEEEEVDIRPSDLTNVVWDPRVEVSHVISPDTQSGEVVDEPAALFLEDNNGDVQQPESFLHDAVRPSAVRSRPEHRDEETSSNPSHGVPHSLRSLPSSISSAAQSIQDVPTDQEMRDSLNGATRVEGARITSNLPEGPLPADDGMSTLRKRILEIQSADGSQEEKSRSMHALMTESYNLSHPYLQSPRPRSKSPASFSSLDRPNSPRSNSPYKHANLAISLPTSLSPVANAPGSFDLSPEDIEPTYYSKPHSSPISQDNHDRAAEFGNNSGETTEDVKFFGCAHYKRNIKLQCSACGRWYTCRFCHDAVEDHSLNRRETKHMLCMFCGCAQKASHDCTNCGESAAWYYCDVCKLWDDDPRRSIYHCHDCGICRVGEGLGKDFFHCKVR